MYMLDTDICIYIIKRKPQQALRHLERARPGEVCMSAITFAELMNGARKSRQIKRNLSKLNAIAKLIAILPFDRDAAVAYGYVRADLEKQGEVIGSNDMLIAAHAISRGIILITNNEREFSRVKNLSLENWTKE